jgi:hypothetical protein
MVIYDTLEYTLAEHTFYTSLSNGSQTEGNEVIGHHKGFISAILSSMG